MYRCFTSIRVKKMIHQEEILENILARLPAKSIGQLRYVSKSWKTLLSQPHFIKTHLNRIKQDPREEGSLMLFSEESGCYYTAKLKYADQGLNELTAYGTKLHFHDLILDGNAIINDKMACCDGLVVIDEGDKLLLMNPTTSEIKKVPVSPHANMFGLGYNSLTDDYKVVRLSCFDDSYHSKMFVDVFSVKHGLWNRTEYPQYQRFSIDERIAPGIFIEGCIYWLIRSSRVIVAYDVEKEEFYKVTSPASSGELDVDPRFRVSLVVLGGCLCMSHITSSGSIDIWMMQNFGFEESWTKFTTIEFKILRLRPICLVGKEQLVLVKDQNSCLAKLVVYNKEEGILKDIVVQGIPDELGLCKTFGRTFLESLVSPHCRIEALKGTEQAMSIDKAKKRKLKKRRDFRNLSKGELH